MRGNICFDFFFSSRNHNIYILTVTRLFNHANESVSSKNAVRLLNKTVRKKSETKINAVSAK